jgi:hypothetical protein
MLSSAGEGEMGGRGKGRVGQETYACNVCICKTEGEGGGGGE